MREIKFRAWHTNDFPVKSYQNTYLSNSLLDLNGCMDGVAYGNVILEQYIGLKDKNNKEIYEGDILEWVVAGKKIYCSVYYNRKKAMFALRKLDSQIYFDCDNINEMEIVGNIHQNSELMNG